jgi:hypothetical protein
MQYSVSFRYINPDFTCESLEGGLWHVDYTDDEAFITTLNRMAIASTEPAVVDFPEAEVRAKNKRVTVRAINGQLYYTDLHSQNRKNLKVVPVEIVRLIAGLSLEEVFRSKTTADEAIYLLPKHKPRSGANPLIKLLSVIIMLVILGFCTKLFWEDLTRMPRLHTAPHFIPSLGGESEVLRKYADVYVSEYREGAMLFELTREGRFVRYEMWFSPERNGYVLVPMDVHRLQVGLHNGETAFLADEIHLLTPLGVEAIMLHGVTFQRHHGELSSIGEVLK